MTRKRDDSIVAGAYGSPPLNKQKAEWPDTERSKSMPDEPMGAQCLRRAHEDHHHLMNEYDSWMKLIEDPAVRDKLREVLEDVNGRLFDFEDHFHNKIYGHLPPLKYRFQEPEPPPEPQVPPGQEARARARGDLDPEVLGAEGQKALAESCRQTTAGMAAVNDQVNELRQLLRWRTM